MKKLVFRVIILLFGLALGLFAAEVACKILELRAARQYRRVSSAISRPSRIPDVRFELIPNTSGITPGQDKVIRINSHGFRGPEIAHPKPEGVFRLAVLGDSIAFGRTLEEEDVFPYQLPDLLRERVPGRQFDVINASLSGRDTWEEVSLLEHRVLDLQPDLVIIQICLNDHVRFPPPDPSAHRGAFGERRWYAYSSLLALLDERVPGFRNHHVRIAERFGFDMRTASEALRDYAIDIAHLHDIAAHWDIWRPLFLRAHELCQQHHAQLMLVVFPTSRLIGMPETASAIPELTGLAREHNIPLVDLLQPFRDAPGSVLTDYTHPNVQGQRLAAQTIADAVVPLLTP